MLEPTASDDCCDDRVVVQTLSLRNVSRIPRGKIASYLGGNCEGEGGTGQ